MYLQTRAGVKAWQIFWLFEEKFAQFNISVSQIEREQIWAFYFLSSKQKKKKPVMILLANCVTPTAGWKKKKSRSPFSHPERTIWYSSYIWKGGKGLDRDLTHTQKKYKKKINSRSRSTHHSRIFVAGGGRLNYLNRHLFLNFFLSSFLFYSSKQPRALL